MRAQTNPPYPPHAARDPIPILQLTVPTTTPILPTPIVPTHLRQQPPH